MRTPEQKTGAVEYYAKYGRKATATICELGYPSRALLVSWHREWLGNGHRFRVRPAGRYSAGQRRASVSLSP